MKFLNTEHVLPAMKHCVAVWADRAKVGDGIESIFTIREREWLEVMDMNEVLSDLAIPCLKVEAAHSAVETMVRQACLSSLGVTLISIYADLLLCAFNVFLSGFEFIGELSLACCDMNRDCFAKFAETFPCGCNL